MSKSLAEPMVAKYVFISERQYRILDLVKTHGGGSHSKVIRKALDTELEGMIFLLKDCCGVNVEEELAKRCA